MAQCGEEHSVCLDSSGSVWVTGSNSKGQLGVPEDRVVNIPKMVVDLPSIVSVSCGSFFTACVDSSGVVWTFGCNGNGELGIGSTSNEIRKPQKVEGMQAIKSIYCGGNHTLCISELDQVYCWGKNDSKQIGAQEAIVTKPYLLFKKPAFKMFACGKSHTIGLTVDGEVIVSGSDRDRQLGCGSNPRSFQRNVHFLVLRLKNIAFVACGNSHSLFLNDEGEVYAVGACSCFGPHVGRNPLPVRIPNLPLIQKIFCGYDHSFCIDVEGGVWGFGNCRKGQLGIGKIDTYHKPVSIPNLTNVTIISTGGFHTILKCTDNRILVSGNNEFGQLGDGSKDNVVHTFTALPEEHWDILPIPYVQRKSARK